MHYGPVFTDAEWLELPQTFGSCIGETFLRNFRILVVDTGLEVEDYRDFGSDLVEKYLMKKPSQSPVSGFVFISEFTWNMNVRGLANLIANELSTVYQFIEHTGEQKGEVAHDLRKRLSGLFMTASKHFLCDSSGQPHPIE